MVYSLSLAMLPNVWVQISVLTMSDTDSCNITPLSERIEKISDCCLMFMLQLLQKHTLWDQIHNGTQVTLGKQKSIIVVESENGGSEVSYPTMILTYKAQC